MAANALRSDAVEDGQPSARARRLILELWARTRVDWGFASERLAQAFRREPGLATAERRAVAEGLYGMIRQARRVDHALQCAGAPLAAGAQPERMQWLAYRLLAGEIQADAARRELPGVDWDAVARVDAAIAAEPTAERRLALGASLPDWLATRLCAQYGDGAAPLAAALNRQAPLGVRANRLVLERSELAERLASEGVQTRPMRFAADGLVLETRVNAFGLVAFREGLFEVQDEASQLIAELVSPPMRGLSIDACAGAGGKTLALGARMRNKGRLLALDISERRLQELRRRARRAGLSNTRALRIDAGGAEPPPELLAARGRALTVLVDAPCSGTGALRRNPEARWRLGEEELARLPEQQLWIALRAAEWVAPGGRLVYATCSLLAEENQQLLARLVEQLGAGWVRVPLGERLGRERAAELASADGLALATRPDRHDTDGFFAAVLRRKG